jgi:spore coat polysaccharide biosynthesis protein SpsF
MLGTLGIVQVDLHDGRFTDSRQLSQFASRKFGGHAILDWVVRRVTDCAQLDAVIVVTSNEVADSVAALVPADVPVFSSQRDDALARFAEAVDEFPCQSIVRVSLDSPFVDPALLDRLVITAAEHPGCDFIGYRSSDGQPAVKSSLGVFGDWFTRDSILQANRDATLAADRNEVPRFLYSHPETFQLRLLQMPTQLDRADFRLALDGEEDWEHAESIFEALGHEDFDWQGIAGLLDQQPVLRERMAVLNQTRERV